MSLTAREFWTVVHGMILGSFFLLAFAGGLAGLSSLGPEWVTAEGLRERTRRLIGGTWVMAVVAWLTVVSGTFFVYPWYRAKPPAGTTDLTSYPRYMLLAKPETAGWHKFGMEWKEHVAWLAPILATAVAYGRSADPASVSFARFLVLYSRLSSNHLAVLVTLSETPLGRAPAGHWRSRQAPPTAPSPGGLDSDSVGGRGAASGR